MCQNVNIVLSCGQFPCKLFYTYWQMSGQFPGEPTSSSSGVHRCLASAFEWAFLQRGMPHCNSLLCCQTMHSATKCMLAFVITQLVCLVHLMQPLKLQSCTIFPNNIRHLGSIQVLSCRANVSCCINTTLITLPSVIAIYTYTTKL